MNRRSFIIILFLLTSLARTAVSQGVTGSSDTVRILSFNIYHGATMKGDFNLDLIAGVIKEADPDLVALQEVDFKTRRALGYDLATELGWRTKMASLFGMAMPYDGGGYGEGVLSRYSFIASRNMPLPFTGNNEPRAALMVTTKLPEGDTIIFIGTHFDHTGNEADRILQAKKVNELLSGVRYPAILAGDLNAEPGSTPILILEDLWGHAYDEAVPSPTYPSDAPAKKIDYVMYYPKDRWKVISSEVICDSVVSDHCAHLVVLELLEGGIKDQSGRSK